MALTVQMVVDAMLNEGLHAFVERYNSENEAMIAVGDEPPDEQGDVEVFVDGGAEHGLVIVTVELDTEGDPEALEGTV